MRRSSIVWYGSSDSRIAERLVSLATPAQLMRVFDVDLWRTDRPGDVDRFDADRFGLWLEVLVESGASNAALKVAGLDVDFVTAAMAEHLVVIDQSAEVAAALFRQIVNDSQEEELFERPSIIDRIREGGVTSELGGYAIVAKRSDSWDALVAVLGALHDEHPDFFQRLMSTSCSVSAKQIDDSSGSYDLLNAPEQLRFDVAFDREQRREGQGYVTAPQAAAFLQSARCLGLRAEVAPARDDITRAYFRELERRPRWSEREPSTPTPRFRVVDTIGARNGQLHGNASRRWSGDRYAACPSCRRERRRERSALDADRHMQFVSEHDEEAFCETKRRTRLPGQRARLGLLVQFGSIQHGRCPGRRGGDVQSRPGELAASMARCPRTPSTTGRQPTAVLCCRRFSPAPRSRDGRSGLAGRFCTSRSLSTLPAV